MKCKRFLFLPWLHNSDRAHFRTCAISSNCKLQVDEEQRGFLRAKWLISTASWTHFIVNVALNIALAPHYRGIIIGDLPLAPALHCDAHRIVFGAVCVHSHLAQFIQIMPWEVASPLASACARTVFSALLRDPQETRRKHLAVCIINVGNYPRVAHMSVFN